MRCFTGPDAGTRRGSQLQLVAVATGLLAVSGPAFAGKILDAIRNYDLNDYSLGVAVSFSQTPYEGAEDSKIVYPYLTSFTHPSFTDDWLVLSDAELGVRRVTKNGWEFGALTRIQTLGLGADPPENLEGLDDKKWNLEAAPYIGYRG